MTYTKYPRTQIVFANEQRRETFYQKCREAGKPYSWVLNRLVEKWLKGRIKLT